ncbi:hypothetical protein PINS_up018431 [Pythium insidiosum]|nr:hypothetical protein PINS_up018431 [Pythium insidiosum]
MTGTSSAWSAHTTKDGRVYYYNRQTKQSSWEKPDDFDSDASGVAEVVSGDSASGDKAAEWEELWDPKNARPYYYNRGTRKTQWARPEGVQIKPYAGSRTAGVSSSSSVDSKEKQRKSEKKKLSSASSEHAKKGEDTIVSAEDSAPQQASQDAKDEALSSVSVPRHQVSSSTLLSVDSAQDAGDASHGVSSAPVRATLALDDEDGAGEEDLNDADDKTHKRRGKLDHLGQVPGSHKKRRTDLDRRMIICDEDDGAMLDSNAAVLEQDTDDGKEASRLLQELSRPDAIMETNVLNLINGFLRAYNDSNGPEILVEKLSSSYRGHAQMVGLVGSWLDSLPVSKTALEHKIAFDVSEVAAAHSKRSATWDPAADILYNHLKDVIDQHYEPKLVSNVLSGSETEPQWLSDMLSDRKSRLMLIELAEKHKYAVRRISGAGHHKELASIATANAFFSVFNGILLDAFCRIPFSSDDDAQEDLAALQKICCHSAYSFVYAEELLDTLDHKLAGLQDEVGVEQVSVRAHYRMVRSKLSRVRFDLQATAIDKFGPLVEAFHPLRRRSLMDLNPKFSQAILSIVKSRHCSESAADVLVKEYRSPETAPPVAHLRNPLIFRSLLDPMFNPALPLTEAHAANCIHLLGYAACAKDERSILRSSTAPASKNTVSLDIGELEKTKLALQEASTVCRSDHTLSYNMSSSGVFEKLGEVMEVPLASIGVLHWVEVTLRSPTFYNSSLLNVCFPSLLRILKGSIRRHVSQWPIAFRVLVVALRMHPDINPVKALELKRESLRCMVFMITSGYVLPVLEFILSNTVDLDQSLLRSFITLLMAQIAPPYSAKFVLALTKILTHPKVQSAIKSCPSECKARLKGFLSYCQKNQGVLTPDQLQALTIGVDGL